MAISMVSNDFELLAMVSEPTENGVALFLPLVKIGNRIKTAGRFIAVANCGNLKELPTIEGNVQHCPIYDGELAVSLRPTVVKVQSRVQDENGNNVYEFTGEEEPVNRIIAFLEATDNFVPSGKVFNRVLSEKALASLTKNNKQPATKKKTSKKSTSKQQAVIE